MKIAAILNNTNDWKKYTEGLGKYEHLNPNTLFLKAFEDLGHEVFKFENSKALSGNYDFIWYNENADVDTEDLKEIKVPRILSIGDPDVTLSEALSEFSSVADLICVRQKKAAGSFKYNNRFVWLPYAFDPEIMQSNQKERDIDILFVGAMNVPANSERGSYVNALQKEFGNKFVFKQGLDWQKYVDLTYRAKIVFNFSTLPIVMRIFEAMGCGSCLLNNISGDLVELFAEDKEVSMYKNLDDCMRKAKFLLDHDELRKYIAENGKRAIFDKHLYKHRAERMLEIIKCL